MSQINCEACETLRVNAAAFVQHGVTNTECNSMANDTGINPNLSPKHNDATDLHTANDCLIGKMTDDLESYNVCDWQDFMKHFIANLHALLKLMICAMGGIWSKIHDLITRVTNLESRMTNVEGKVSTLETTVAGHTTAINNLTNQVNTLSTGYQNLNHTVQQLIEAMGGSSNTVTVVKKYSYTVPASKFIKTNHWDGYSQSGYNVEIGQWFSGAPEGDECYISIPITDMESVVGVWAQPYVVPTGNPFDGKGRVAMQTVAVQTWNQQGNNIIVNFDTYELDYPTATGFYGAPYPITVDFLVVGTKTITTLS